MTGSKKKEKNNKPNHHNQKKNPVENTLQTAPTLLKFSSWGGSLCSFAFNYCVGIGEIPVDLDRSIAAKYAVIAVAKTSLLIKPQAPELARVGCSSVPPPQAQHREQKSFCFRHRSCLQQKVVLEKLPCHSYGFTGSLI